jgi:N-hydroxyarylamine O-acetyltransferase
MATPEGRTTVSDRRLIFTRNGEKKERLLNSEDEWKIALHEHFGVVL